MNRSNLNAALSKIDAGVPRLLARLRLRLIKTGLGFDVNPEQWLASQLLSVMMESRRIACMLSRPGMALAQSPEDAVSSLFESIAKSAAGKTLAKVTDKLSAAIASGPKGSKKQVLSIVDEATPTHIVKTLVKTQSSLAYNASVWTEDAKLGDLWGYELITADDENVRQAHYDMHGVRYPKTHKFWNTAFPPNGWGCRCGARAIFVGDKDAKLRPMKAPLIVDPNFAFNPGKMFPLD